MTTKLTNEQIYSQVFIQKIAEHQDHFGMPGSKTDLQLMPLSDYRDMSQRDAFFYVDHNGFLRHQFSGEVMASSKQQLDILIDQLKAKRQFLEDAMDCAKE
ncbi:hypothetical protein PRCB_11765 [Pantoea rodasii]|uniref:Uncharacterized protein n=1 Tax=Pantoea rodasii TaxID=1076549 RepID=A0A2M9WCV0_9GAMM|nr:hypothetical protein [Pantoea rodasii]ORM60118.1 hypothetical protein HA45_22135 [Pantoea rodasii]PJZ05359.1 hypothetical protein PRCB_11765 [Pantoea rodasii]